MSFSSSAPTADVVADAGTHGRVDAATELDGDLPFPNSHGRVVDVDLDTEEESGTRRRDRVPGAPPSIQARRALRRGTRGTQKWARLLHVYTSMVCFVVVLFFAVTGVTLNHPTWSLGGESHRTVHGMLPADWRTDGTVDWLRVAEYLRAAHSLQGTVADHNDSAVQASIAFKGPGYRADAFIDAKTGAYDLTIDAKGVVAVMNDLHKGRDTGSSWKWLIDVAGGFLTVVSLTGLVLQLVLRKRRRSSLLTAAGGALVLAVLVLITTR